MDERTEDEKRRTNFFSWFSIEIQNDGPIELQVTGFDLKKTFDQRTDDETFLPSLIDRAEDMTEDISARSSSLTFALERVQDFSLICNTGRCHLHFQFASLHIVLRMISILNITQ